MGSITSNDGARLNADGSSATSSRRRSCINVASIELLPLSVTELLDDEEADEREFDALMAGGLLGSDGAAYRPEAEDLPRRATLLKSMAFMASSGSLECSPGMAVASCGLDLLGGRTSTGGGLTK